MNEQLYHWGIKGMKWGQRRFQNKDGSLTPAGKKRYSIIEVHEDHVKATSSKDPRSMSDTELRARINRLQMEKQYNDLSKANIQAGKTASNKTLKVIGTVTAATLGVAGTAAVGAAFKTIGKQVGGSVGGAAAKPLVGFAERKVNPKVVNVIETTIEKMLKKNSEKNVKWVL